MNNIFKDLSNNILRNIKVLLDIAENYESLEKENALGTYTNLIMHGRVINKFFSKNLENLHNLNDKTDAYYGGYAHNELRKGLTDIISIKSSKSDDIFGSLMDAQKLIIEHLSSSEPENLKKFKLNSRYFFGLHGMSLETLGNMKTYIEKVLLITESTELQIQILEEYLGVRKNPETFYTRENRIQQLLNLHSHDDIEVITWQWYTHDGRLTLGSIKNSILNSETEEILEVVHEMFPIIKDAYPDRYI